MQENILSPKWAKNKKPIKKRKPSKPLDGINHRLLREQAEKAAIEAAPVVIEPVVVENDDAMPTREELETKATELGLKFDGRTSDKKLTKLIAEALGE